MLTTTRRKLLPMIAALIFTLLLAALQSFATVSQNSRELLNENQVNDAAFNSDGEYLAAVSGGRCGIFIWEVRSVTLQEHFEVCSSQDGWGLGSIDWSPDSKKLVVTRVYSTDVWIIDVAAKMITLRLIGNENEVRGAIYSPNGEMVATFDTRGVVKVWDVHSGQEIAALTGHTDWITSAAFNADTSSLVTSSFDGTARIWDIKTNEVTQILAGHSATVFFASFSPNSEYVITAGADNTARVWSTSTGTQIDQFNGSGWVMKGYFAPDNHMVVLSEWLSGNLFVWELGTSTPIRTEDIGLSTSKLISLSSPNDG